MSVLPKILVCLLLVSASGLALAKSALEEYLCSGYYLAIAWSDQGPRYAFGHGRTQDEAQTKALKSCGDGCGIIDWTSDGYCLALAVRADGLWYTAGGDSADEARQRASNECRREYGKCRVVMVKCACQP